MSIQRINSCADEDNRAPTRLADSAWHRMQRAWPMVRMMPPTSIKPARYYRPTLATNPCFHGPHFNADTWVTLEVAKQGVYQGRPATFVYLEAFHSQWWKLRQTIFDVRLETRQSGPAASSSNALIVAYGPAYITQPVTTESGEMIPQAKCPRIEGISTEHGVRFIVSACPENERGVLEAFKIGLVVVHEQEALLKVFLSSDSKVRATILKRAKVWPLKLDMGTELRPFIETCGRMNGEPCSESCADFGPEHLTAAHWTSLLAQMHAQFYRGSGPGETWVKYVEDWNAQGEA